MVCKLCGKTKKEHFSRKDESEKKGFGYFCTKYGKKKFVLPNACEVCGVETHMGPDGQYICYECRDEQEEADYYKRNNNIERDEGVGHSLSHVQSNDALCEGGENE